MKYEAYIGDEWCRILIVKHLVRCIVGHLEVMLSLGQRLGKSISLLVTILSRFLVVLHVHGTVSRYCLTVAEIRFCALHLLNDLVEFVLRVLVDWSLFGWVVIFVSCCEEFILLAERDTALPESL